MSRKSARHQSRSSDVKENVQAATGSKANHKYRRWLIGSGILAVISLISVGVLAERGVIGGKSAELTATKQGATLNPIPTPTSTPQLSKEYIYAGSRMLAVEDANAPHSSNQPSDLVVWRKSNGTWYINDSTSGQFSSGVFGQDGDKPAPADFDGDGLYDFCVYRPSNGTWYVQPNNGGSFYGVQFGLASDIPVPADYDGDGRADIAVWRSSDAKYYVLNSSTSTASIITIGQTNDTPIPADYDGDGRADAATYRVSGTYARWTIRKTSNNQEQVTDYGWGTGAQAADKPVVGDYDGDGRFDIAIRRDSENKWYYNASSTNTTHNISLSMQSSDVSVAGDYDGDGKTDVAVYRDGTASSIQSYWYIRKSSDGTMRTDQWGQHQDIPVPAPFRR